jgi:diguanylate cyclase (GGDEF)-like protein/PAS domain S-box-containing protein
MGPLRDRFDHPALRRVGEVSARRVAAGGEGRLWRWTIPLLAIAALALAAQRVDGLQRVADDAGARSALAQEVVDDVMLGAPRADLRADVKRLRALEPGDPGVHELSRTVWLPVATARDGQRAAALARSVDSRFGQAADDAERAAERARRLLLGIGVALVLLLLWCFWSRRAAVQVALHDRRFRSLVRNASDLIVVLDGDGRITDCTPVVADMLGRSPESLVDTELRAIVHPEDEVPPAGDPAARAWRALHADGSWIDVESTSTDLRDDASVGGIVLVVRDVRERKAFEQQLHHAAFHDALTGLPNRALFEDRVRQAVARARRSETLVAVLFVDLDDFKTVNDSLGHAAGDDLLRLTAARLDESLRAEDTAARLGGDEFAVLVEGLDDADGVARVAERIHEALDRPFRVGDEELFVRASIGIAIREGDQLDKDLLRNADTAMYAAKGAGKGRHELFHPVMHDTARRRLQLTGDLRRAVSKGEFTVDYQPLVDLADGTILGAEALVRWDHPQFGRIAPADFIPLAEETGLIVPIGDFVLREACRQARAWRDMDPGGAAKYVSVNLSSRQFRPPGRIVEQVLAVTSEFGLEPSSLLLEITESLLVHDREHAAEDLQALRDVGVRVAIDDFGTGYSSLSYLRDFPIDIVKMDRSFVQDLGRGAADDALVRSVLELGEALDMQIVAEGIEELSQLDSLRDLRCGIGQGYLFSQPVSGDLIGGVLRGEHPAPPAPGGTDRGSSGRTDATPPQS